MKRKPNIAIIGATGLVGITMIKVLEQSNLDIDNLYLYASSKSKGKIMYFRGKKYIVDELSEESLKKEIDIVLNATNKDISSKFIPILLSRNIYVIDNSSFYRLHNNVPLVVCGINDYLVNKESLLIANPNCSTIISLLAIHLINEKYKLKRIIYNTYQAVSGSGYRGILDLVNTLEGKENRFYDDVIAQNLIPVIGEINKDNYSTEELKMINETKKVLNNYEIGVSATCIRVPVVNSHSISINLECESEFKIEDIVSLLKESEYLKIYENNYPTPIKTSESDIVHIGRIRIDDSLNHGLNMWVVADNLRVGAATNAVRILKILGKELDYDF